MIISHKKIILLISGVLISYRVKINDFSFTIYKIIQILLKIIIAQKYYIRQIKKSP